MYLVSAHALTNNELLQFGPKSQLQTIEKIRQYAKNEDQRTAAEDLLQMLIKNWWSKARACEILLETASLQISLSCRDRFHAFFCS
jgi:chromosome condensin MukBEF complex kleisin-like MukF subunit